MPKKLNRMNGQVVGHTPAMYKAQIFNLLNKADDIATQCEECAWTTGEGLHLVCDLM